ncbi:MAG TPA: carboxypeptidase regulatory-like domain-containing protein [Pyrinomonadaceae bacterium]
MRSFLSSLLLLACILCGTSSAFAQGTNLGTIRGRVTDPAGAAVQNASVQVTDVETNISRDLTTNADGEYEAAALKSGTYKVTITVQGFATRVIRAVLAGSDTVRADAALEVGGAVETVEVQAEAGVIQADTPTIASSITNRQLTELPRESRDIYQFLYLNPNITQGPADGDGFKFIGAQSYGASFSLDGQRANGGIFGGVTQSQPSLEVIQELTVLSNSFSAEYGGIANIRVVTKRGGADFHGSLFYNNRNSALAAWRLQDKNAKATFTPTTFRPKFETPYFNLNELGGSFSGPVPFSRKRTFFLTSYERRWDLAPLTFRASDLPTSTVLNGNFTGLNATTRPAVPADLLPLLTAQELGCGNGTNTFRSGPCDPNNPPSPTNVTNPLRFNVIPQRLLNPIALAFVNTYYPNTGAAPFNPANGRLREEYYQNVPGLVTRDLFTGRVDHDFSEKDKVYAVYNYQRRNGVRAFAANLPSLGLRDQEGSNHTLALSYTRVFSPSVVNEARGGFNTQAQYTHAKQTVRQFLSGIGFNEQEITSYGNVVGPELVDSYGHIAFTIMGPRNLTAGGRSVDRSFDQSLITFGDTLTVIRGQHTLKAGADFVRNQAIDDFVRNRNDPRGTIIYPNNFGGFARFLTGLPPNEVRYVFNVRPSMDVHNWETGYFVQDDWKAHPRLTLSLGLRYDLITPFVDKSNLFINFDPSGTGRNGLKGVFIVPTADIIPQLHPGFAAQGIITAEEAGVGRGLVKTDKNNFAPRVGAAWRVTDNTVIRGGFGMFYPTSAAQGQRDAFGSTAFNQRIRRLNTAAAPLSPLPGGINPRGTTPFTGGANPIVQGLSINAIPTDLQSPRIDQFNLTLERDLGWKTGLRASYLGSRMHGLIAGRDLNLLPPSDTPFGTTTGNGTTFCNPYVNPNDPADVARDFIACDISAADRARLPFSQFGDFLASYGNIGTGDSDALQLELNRRFSGGLTFNFSYTLLDQNSSGLDVGASSLGGTLYNQFNPQGDYSRDAFVSRHRFVYYGAYDVPLGRRRRFGKEMNRALDAVAGGWQVTWNGFAKSGTGFTPFWACNNCSPAFPGNIASSFSDPVGAFEGIVGYRATVNGNGPYLRQGDQFFNPAAFGLPSVGADLFSNPAAAKRNFLTGPGTWGMNLGLRKYFNFSETTRLEAGADFNNVFNHPLKSPQSLYFARVGDFSIDVDPVTGKPFINPAGVIPNPQFGRTIDSFRQEGIEDRRLVRVRLRLTF